MATTTQRKALKGPRVRGSAAARRKEAVGAESADGRYGLLTAALVGVAIGAGSSLLFRHKTSIRKRLPEPGRLRGYYESAKDSIDGYYENAKESLDNFVDTELNDLRRAIKRRRRKLGL